MPRVSNGKRFYAQPLNRNIFGGKEVSHTLFDTHQSFTEDAAHAYHSPLLLRGVFLFTALMLGAAISVMHWPTPKPTEPPTFTVNIIPLNPQEMSRPTSLLPEHSPLRIPLPDAFHASPRRKSQSSTSAPIVTQRQDIIPLDINDPQMPSAQPAARLFNSNIQQKLDAALSHNATQTPNINKMPITTYQTSDGHTMAALNGRCYRVYDDPMSPTGKRWSLPTRCAGVKTESDKIAEGLARAMKERFGEN